MGSEEEDAAVQSERERPLETVLPSFLAVRPSSPLYFVLTRVLEDQFFWITINLINLDLNKRSMEYEDKFTK